ncbi:MAG: copper homeostasis protein CutC [Bacteroidales bacterium]|nr:copper homeostasis protein CutC [Bacteroidales bacterium]
MILEIAVFSLESAIAAFNAGADRIELCSAPAEGGLTPSAATMRLARKYVKIPIHIMIRPREGDFCYSAKEFEAMLLDIAAAKMVGMEGVVAGVLNPDGSVDEKRTAILVDAAAPMNVTFHRAFDMTKDQDEALEAIIYAGCARILTSGGQQTAPQGIEKLAELVQKAGDRISIMPGSGINLDNIKHITDITNAKEIHLSARSFVAGKMKFRQPLVTMGGTVTIPDYELQLPDEKAIKDIQKLFV